MKNNASRVGNTLRPLVRFLDMVGWPILALGNSWLWAEVWPILPENIEIPIVVAPWIPAIIRSFYVMMNLNARGESLPPRKETHAEG